MATAFCQQVTPGKVDTFFPFELLRRMKGVYILVCQHDGRLQLDAYSLFGLPELVFRDSQRMQLHLVEHFFVFHYRLVALITHAAEDSANRFPQRSGVESRTFQNLFPIRPVGIYDYIHRFESI